MDDVIVMMYVIMGYSLEDAEREAEAYYEEMCDDDALEEMYPTGCWDEGIY